MLSRATHYAVTGMLRLALLPHGGYCRVDDLVRGTDAPRHAVAKVFHGLAQRGLLESVRGTRGGFRLAKDTLERTLAEIIEALEGLPRDRGRIDRGLCLPGEPCPFGELIAPIARQLDEVLSHTRLVDLLRGVGSRGGCCPTCGGTSAAAPVHSPVTSITGVCP